MARLLNIKIWLPAVVIISVVVITFLNRHRGNGNGLVAAVERQRSPVRTTVLAKTVLVESLEHTALLEPARDVILTSEIAGKVLRVYKDLGESCPAGQVQVQIDPEPYRIAVGEAESGLRLARVQLEQAKREDERTRRLREEGVATSRDSEQAESALGAAAATVQRAEAALELARRNLRESAVRCPFDGVVARRLVEPGQLVGPQTPLARVVDVHTLKLTLGVPAATLTRLAAGQEVRVTDADRAERAGRGVIARLGVAADESTRTFPVEVRLTENGGLRAGEIVRVRIAVLEHRDVIAVPEDAVATRDGQPSVLVIADGRAEARAVQTSTRVAGRLIVTGGLRAGDEVVVVGQHGLASGSAVDVLSRSEPPAGSGAQAAAAAGSTDEGGAAPAVP